MGQDRRGALPFAGGVAAVIAIVCCAGLPALGAALGGLTVAAVLGVGGGMFLVAGMAVVAVLVLRSRRRGRRDPPARRPAP